MYWLDAYDAGFQAGYYLTERPPCPHATGSRAARSWLTGQDEGHRARIAEATERAPEPVATPDAARPKRAVSP